MIYPVSVSDTAVPITPSDSVYLDRQCRVVDVMAAGSVSFQDALNNTVILPNVIAGYTIKGIVRRINATGTTATGFIGYP